MADFEAAIDYLAVDHPGVALQMSRQIRSEVTQLKRSPWIGRPGRVTDTRELVIARSPDIAVYSVSESIVRVLRTLHGAREWPPQPPQP